MTVSVRTSPSGPLRVITEGVLRNLTDVAYVDNNGTAPDTPDGNIESPFVTFDSAQQTLPETIYVVPGNYAPEGTITYLPLGGSVIGMGLAAQDGFPFFQNHAPLLPALNLAPGAGQNEYLFENVSVSITGMDAFVNSITFRNCYGGATAAGAPGQCTTYVDGGSFSGVAGAGGIIAKNMTSPLGINCTTGASFNRFTNSNFTVGITFDVPGGTAELDVATVMSFHRASTAISNGGVRVLDGPRMMLKWGANAANTGDFLVPDSKDSAANAALTANWSSLISSGLGPAGEAWAHVLHVQLSAAHTDDITVTLFVGATIGGAAATALTTTITAGQTSAIFELSTELVIVSPNNYMGIQFTSANPLAANNIEVLVGLT